MRSGSTTIAVTPPSHPVEPRPSGILVRRKGQDRISQRPSPRILRRSCQPRSPSAQLRPGEPSPACQSARRASRLWRGFGNPTRKKGFCSRGQLNPSVRFCQWNRRGSFPLGLGGVIRPASSRPAAHAPLAPAPEGPVQALAGSRSTAPRLLRSPGLDSLHWGILQSLNQFRFNVRLKLPLPPHGIGELVERNKRHPQFSDRRPLGFPPVTTAPAIPLQGRWAFLSPAFRGLGGYHGRNRFANRWVKEKDWAPVESLGGGEA